MRRKRILEAARAVFREKGFEGASTREIAERADVGAGTIFLYARDKRELLVMIVNDELDTMNQHSLATLPDGAPLVSQLLHYFAPHYRFWEQDIPLARLASAEMHAGLTRPPDGRGETELLHERRARTIAALVDLVERAQQSRAKSLRCDPLIAAHLIFDAFIGENRKWLSEERPTAREGIERLREVLAFAMRGFDEKPKRRTRR